MTSSAAKAGQILSIDVMGCVGEHEADDTQRLTLSNRNKKYNKIDLIEKNVRIKKNHPKAFLSRFLWIQNGRLSPLSLVASKKLLANRGMHRSQR